MALAPRKEEKQIHPERTLGSTAAPPTEPRPGSHGQRRRFAGRFLLLSGDESAPTRCVRTGGRGKLKGVEN
jgi:hypothetical protein